MQKPLVRPFSGVACHGSAARGPTSPCHSKRTLEGLPAEILRQIARDIRAEHRPSLYSFASVNKMCYGAAIPLLFQSVVLNCHHTSDEALAREVAECLSVLEVSQARRHVRRLTLAAYSKPQSAVSQGQRHSPPSRPPLHPSEMLFATKVAGAHEVDRNALWRASITHWYPSRISGAWLRSSQCCSGHTVIPLLEALPNLTDLVIDANHNCAALLEVWRWGSSESSRRITVRDQVFEEGPNINRPEYQTAVAASPALYSASVSRDGYSANDNDPLLAMVAGGAPHLRELQFVGGTWVPKGPVPKLGSLTSLSLWHPDEGDLSIWARHTDFKSLQNFSIVDYSLTVADLDWLAAVNRFPNLRLLNVMIGIWSTEAEDEQFFNAKVESAKAFFGGLPNLENLTLHTHSHARELISYVLSRHGSSLRKLHLQAFSEKYHPGDGFDLDTFRDIRDCCPSLQYLRTDLRRTFSDTQEAAIYRTISGMSSLCEIVLWLKCCYVCWPRHGETIADLPTSWSSYDLEPCSFINHREGHWIMRNGHVRELLANSAFDEPLARSVWNTIHGGGNGPRLQSLTLHLENNASLPAEGQAQEWRQIYIMLQKMKRSFLFQQSVCKDDETLLVGEIPNEAPPGSASMAGGVSGLDTVEAPVRGSPLHIFRLVWPENKGSKGWNDDWFGMPLESLSISGHAT